MEKFVPYEKKSKKEKRKEDSKRRTTWNGVNPKTKVIPDLHKQKRDMECMEDRSDE